MFGFKQIIATITNQSSTQHSLTSWSHINKYQLKNNTMRANQCWIIWPSDVPKQFYLGHLKSIQLISMKRHWFKWYFLTLKNIMQTRYIITFFISFQSLTWPPLTALFFQKAVCYEFAKKRFFSQFPIFSHALFNDICNLW